MKSYIGLNTGVNNLPKVVAQQCRGQELNPQPPDHESDTLATTPAPPSHPKTVPCVFTQGAYKYGKMKFPEFSRFSRPSEQSFPDNYKAKTRYKELP